MTATRWIAAAALLACAPALRAQTPAPVSADSAAGDTAAANAVRDFMYDLAEPVALGSAAAMGLWDHMRTEPYEWGGGLDALSQRMLSRAGGHVIGTSVRHGVAAALGRSTREEHCGCPEFADRAAHVFTETFTDRDLSTGRRVFSEPFIAGTYAGALAPALWHPEVNLWDGVKGGTLSIAFTLIARTVFALLDPDY
jgi:hypothetical protein